jgi:hypothetical protein
MITMPQESRGRSYPGPIPHSEHRDEETYAIIGAAMEVHRELGPGYLEAAYREAMAFALAERGIPFAAEVPFRLRFKGHQLTTHYPGRFCLPGPDHRGVEGFGDLGECRISADPELPESQRTGARAPSELRSASAGVPTRGEIALPGSDRAHDVR